MSTEFIRYSLRTVLASACFMAAGAGVGCVHRQAKVDDRVPGAASHVASAVSDASRLDERCAAIARNLAEAGIRASIAHAPVRRDALAEEGRAVAEFEGAGCPIRALPGIAFGVHEAARMLSAGTRT